MSSAVLLPAESIALAGRYDWSDGGELPAYEEIGGDECGELLPGDENLPLARGAEDPDLYADIEPTRSSQDAADDAGRRA